jgi:iron complex transport system ATP-binding protein
MGVEHLASRPYRLLSQGEQQRVLIARALVCRPALLILDEPCAGLDPVAREGFLMDLDRLCRRPESPTMVMVTHHIEEIGPWIHDVLVIRNGRPLAAGSKENVLRSEVLGEAFGGQCRVEQLDGRYYLRHSTGNGESHGRA